jgi:hypothetical protein
VEQRGKGEDENSFQVEETEKKILKTEIKKNQKICCI